MYHVYFIILIKKILDNCIKRYYNNYNKKFPKYIVEILITIFWVCY